MEGEGMAHTLQFLSMMLQQGQGQGGQPQQQLLLQEIVGQSVKPLSTGFPSTVQENDPSFPSWVGVVRVVFFACVLCAWSS
jgi:hypothetical protein